MGNSKGNFNYQAVLLAKKETQIRHIALEAARIAANRILSEKLGESYFLRIVPYPHHVLRENKMIFGAHADRLQDGMRKAFGKPIGTAARVKAGKPMILIQINENGIETAKEALRLGGIKLPVPSKVSIKKISD
jgi:large subunit ribosomal protein L10e